MNEKQTNRGRFRLPLFVGPFVALIAVIALFAILDYASSEGRFFTTDNLSNVAIQTSVFAIAAVGLTLVIISGGIDLSCGTAVMLSATIVAWCIYQDIGSRITMGSNVRDASMEVATLIKDSADTPTLDQAKSRLQSLIKQKKSRIESQLEKTLANLKAAGWEGLESDDRAEISVSDVDRFDRYDADRKRLQENHKALSERIDSLDQDDFWISVEDAKQNWGNNLPNHPLTVYFALVGGILTGLMCGLINGVLVAFLKIVPFVVTLGTMTIFLGIGNLVSGNVPIRTVRDDQVPPWLYQALSMNSDYLLLGLPPGVWVLFIAAAVVTIVLWGTVFGRYTFAVGSNESTARLCGINVAWQKLLIYAVSGGLIGLAGVFQFSRLCVGDPESGLGFELKVIAAVVIGGGSLTGGRGSILGTICGAAMLAIILNGCTQLGLPVAIEKIVVGSIIIFAVYLDQPAVKQYMKKLFGKQQSD